jgi:hypothetical protein
MYRDFKYGKNGLFPFRESRNGKLFALAKREEKHSFSPKNTGKKWRRKAERTSGFSGSGKGAESFCGLHFCGLPATLPRPIYSTINA